MSIWEGVKDRYWAYEKEILWFGIIFLTASLSFGLGYLAAQELNNSPIIIEKCSETQ